MHVSAFGFHKMPYAHIEFEDLAKKKLDLSLIVGYDASTYVEGETEYNYSAPWGRKKLMSACRILDIRGKLSLTGIASCITLLI